jgi:hypothetical protein
LVAEGVRGFRLLERYTPLKLGAGCQVLGAGGGIVLGDVFRHHPATSNQHQYINKLKFK